MATSLAFIVQQLIIYLGIFLFVTGIIGGLLVLIVFLSLRTFRESSCAFYLTVMSIINVSHLVIGLLSFIMINGFAISWANTSLFYCKFRAFHNQLLILISMSCMCFATIDQFLATCSNPRWHQWNSMKIARHMIIGIVILWILHGIPFLIYYNHSLLSATSALTCLITNIIFQKYLTLFLQPALSTFIPVIIMIVFGLLAYRNVRQIPYRTVPLVRRELDKQLTSMVLVEVFFDVIVISPQLIQSAYYLIYGSPTDSFALIQYNLVRNLASLIYFSHFVCPFYIYVCVSKRFRQQLAHVFFTLHLNRFRRIEPQT